MEWYGKRFFFNHFPSNCCQNIFKVLFEKSYWHWAFHTANAMCKMQSDFAHAYIVHLLHVVLQNILQNMRELEAMSLLYYVPSAILEDALNKSIAKGVKWWERSLAHLLTWSASDQETNTCIQINTFSVMYVFFKVKMKVTQ